jgi:hypothetical protein
LPHFSAPAKLQLQRLPKADQVENTVLNGYKQWLPAHY